MTQSMEPDKTNSSNTKEIKAKSSKTKPVKTSYILTVFFAIVTAFFILTLAIFIPITSKSFYKSEVKRLGLVEKTGYSEETILTAYSEMLDYCNGYQDEFSVGELSFSEEGASHFADCRKLFVLDRHVLIFTAAVALLWLIIRWFVPVRSAAPAGHLPAFYGALFLWATFFIIGGLAALDFDKFFVIFHAVLFPGKTNWLFDPRVDQVINILPETYFMHCGLLIVLLILCMSAAIFLFDLLWRKRKEKRA